MEQTAAPAYSPLANSPANRIPVGQPPQPTPLQELAASALLELDACHSLLNTLTSVGQASGTQQTQSPPPLADTLLALSVGLPELKRRLMELATLTGQIR